MKMVQHKIVEVRRKPIASCRQRGHLHNNFGGGWRRVASPFMVRLANEKIWRRVYVNQLDSELGYRRGTYYIKVGGWKWYTFNYNDIVPFIEVCDAVHSV
jgi:hypothetical protein